MIDQIYNCQLPGEVFGIWDLQCRLRIFEPHSEVQTVLITDMGFEMRRYIPYLVEALADLIVKEFCLDPVRLIWIEHYTHTYRKPSCSDFSQVTFRWHNGKATNPQWTAITPAMAQALISEKLLVA